MKRIVSLVLALLLTLSIGFADAESTQTGIEKLQELIAVIEHNYNVEIGEAEIMESVYKGVVDGLDRHSAYLDEEALEQFESSISGSFIGVGISVVKSDDFIEVVAPISGSPAAAAGIEAGDIIVAVDGESIEKMPLEVVVSKIKGPEGTVVKLTIERAERTLQFDIKRAVVVVKSVEHEIVEGVDIIKIISFDENTTEELLEVLKTIDRDAPLIIDLRNNPGGLLNRVVEIADIFLPKGTPICALKYRSYRDHEFKALQNGMTNPMVVLVDAGSASASELFAGAMQDNGRAKIVGVQTYGKGSVQRLFDLKDGSAVKLTIGEYVTAGGKHIHGIGITPDVVVENGTAVEASVDNFYPMQSLNTSHLGCKDIDTYGMEQRLSYLGYDVALDGLFDQKSVEALRAYQAEMGLTADGRLDIETKIALQSDVVERSLSSVDAQLESALKLLAEYN